MTLAGLTSPIGTDFAPRAVAVAGRAPAPVADVRFEGVLGDSMTAGEPAGVAVRSITENAAWSERVARNLSPLSDSPSSVARAVRESYGRILSARPRRFHAHA